jgi:hypothetical protein
MAQTPRFDLDPEERRPTNELRRVSVHVLSEHEFCPRAALLAFESGDDSGEEESPLGPRLDNLFVDYDEHKFAEALQSGWSELRWWLILAAPASFLVFAMWRLVSPLSGLIVSLPLCYVGVRSYETMCCIARIYRERAIFRVAVPMPVDLKSQQIQEINWWTVRKDGFDCFKPVDPHFSPTDELIGRPWRILTKGTTLRIPVIRKHRGERVYRRQHLIRVAAYCRLIETCEGADSPFGILMFADSYDGILIPASAVGKLQLDAALSRVREFLDTIATGKYVPPAPSDNRCSGCHRGQLRRYIKNESDTVLNGKTLAPFLAPGSGQFRLHCDCGDRFSWVPPHDDTVRSVSPIGFRPTTGFEFPQDADAPYVHLAKRSFVVSLRNQSFSLLRTEGGRRSLQNSYVAKTETCSVDCDRRVLTIAPWTLRRPTHGTATSLRASVDFTSAG